MKPIEIPDRFTGTIYVKFCTDIESYFYGKLVASEYEGGDYMVVGRAEVDIPLDLEDITDRQVEKLHESKQKILAEAQVKANQIDETIRSLLAIEHKGAA